MHLYMFSKEARRGWKTWVNLTSAMTHIRVAGDQMCTLFNWSPHQTEILISSIVTKIV